MYQAAAILAPNGENCDGPGDRETYALSGVFYPNVAAIAG